jgi:hypothetical protein
MFNIPTIPSPYIKLIIGAALFLAGSAAGYKWEESKYLKTKNQLDLVIESEKAAKLAYDKAMLALKQNIADLQLQSNKQLQDYEDKFSLYKKNQDKYLARKNDEIAQLKIIVSSHQTKITLLKTQLSMAVTPEEKAELQAKITEQQLLLDRAQIREEGLSCLATPIPEEYITNLNSL